MTTTVTEATKVFIYSYSYYTISGTVGLIAILLLMALLIQQELLRAYGGPRATKGVVIAKGFIAPLLLSFVVIVAMRFAVILYRYL